MSKINFKKDQESRRQLSAPRSISIEPVKATVDALATEIEVEEKEAEGDEAETDKEIEPDKETEKVNKRSSTRNKKTETV